MLSSLQHALALVYPVWFGRPEDKEAVDNLVDKGSANVCKDLDEVEEALTSQGPYLCGKTFTAAYVVTISLKLSALNADRFYHFFISDIAVAFSCEYVLMKKIGLKGKDDAYPSIKTWLRKIENRPAYEKTLKEGAKHDFCLLHSDL